MAEAEIQDDIEHGERGHRPIRFTVDGEPVETLERELTPVQIMELAGVDPTTHYLKEIRGRQQISYEDRPDEPIRIRRGQRFVTNSREPATVS